MSRNSGRSRRRRSRKEGLPPGSLVHIGETPSEPSQIRVLRYDGDTFEEVAAPRADRCAPSPDDKRVTWIDVANTQDVEIVRQLGVAFGIHVLTQEDVLNMDQRPKVEDFGDYVFLVLRMLSVDDDHNISSRQLSLIIGPNYVLSFHEGSGPAIDIIYERLRQGRGRVRRMGADFLAYALIDVVVDRYFAVLEAFEDRMESIEDQLLQDQGTTRRQLDPQHDLQHLRRQTLLLRHAIWPVRDVVNGMRNERLSIVGDETRIHLKDVVDHVTHAVDILERIREGVTGLFEIQMMMMNGRLNEIIKLLTVMSAIFIPLTFLVGVYGMNFENMPELSWPWAYPAIWAIMIGLGGAMLLYFRRRGWL